jgi:hypothetical protein
LPTPYAHEPAPYPHGPDRRVRFHQRVIGSHHSALGTYPLSVLQDARAGASRLPLIDREKLKGSFEDRSCVTVCEVAFGQTSGQKIVPGGTEGRTDGGDCPVRIPRPEPFAVWGIHTKCAIARKHSAHSRDVMGSAGCGFSLRGEHRGGWLPRAAEHEAVQDVHGVLAVLACWVPKRRISG